MGDAEWNQTRLKRTEEALRCKTSEPLRVPRMTDQHRSNFAHLARLQTDLALLGGREKRFFVKGPNTGLLKLMQLSESMAKYDFARAHVD